MNYTKRVVLYTAPPTRLLHTKAKEILRGIVADIKVKEQNKLTFA